MTPVPGSAVSTRCRRRSPISVPSATSDHPGVDRVADADAAAVMERDPAGAAGGVEQGVEQRPVGDGVAMPSFIASVSRLGEATEPVSRWSRPMTIGAFTFPFFTSQLKRRPISARSPYSSQQIRAGSPWKWTFSLRLLDPARQRLVLGEGLQHRVVGDGDVGRIARERRPAERARRRGRTAAG